MQGLDLGASKASRRILAGAAGQSLRAESECERSL